MDLNAPQFNPLWLLTNPEAPHSSYFISEFSGSFKLPLYSTSSRNAITNVKALGNTEKEISLEGLFEMFHRGEENSIHSLLCDMVSSPL